MSDRDIDELFRRFADLDRELKDLRTEVNQLKWYQQHGTNGAVAYSASTPPVFNSDGTQDYNFYKRHFVNNDKPAQWPNEPYTDYLNRIGEYNEAMIYEDDSK